MIEEQVLIFRVQEEEYAIPFEDSQETIAKLPITKIPTAIDYLEGVTNIHGQVIPVVRLSAKIGLAGDIPSEQKVIIVKIGLQKIGIMVDEITGGVCLTADCIDPANRGNSCLGSCIKGLGEIGNRPIMLLDIARLFSEEELSFLRRLEQLACFY
ncbi:chemotaxis protein CheW [Sporomusa aerivorans]|uniref:chemotaxis protein CheW n=1 Tax=Sporomusa aerivorans TaxID=204936 RepID=UPI00352B22FC